MASARAGLRRRLRVASTHETPPAYIRRLEQELDLIRTRNWEEPFTIAAEVVAWCRANSIAVGPGRGNACGSLVSWALGITEPDPLRHALYFERFVNPLRAALPAYQLDLGGRHFEDAVDHLLHAHAPRATRVFAHESYGADYVAAIAIGLSDIRGQVLTKRQAVDAGHVVLDLFGLRAINELDAANVLDIEDPEALAHLGAGYTDGIPWFDRMVPRRMLAEVQPTCFEELIAVTALDRPGPQANGTYKRYLEARITEAERTHPVVDRILANTHGVLLWQEQVMQICHDVAGFDVASCELARRNLGKRHVGRLGTRFREGAVERGNDSADAERIFKRLEAETGYTYPKAHAVASGYLTMKLASQRCRGGTATVVPIDSRAIVHVDGSIHCETLATTFRETV